MYYPTKWKKRSSQTQSKINKITQIERIVQYKSNNNRHNRDNTNQLTNTSIQAGQECEYAISLTKRKERKQQSVSHLARARLETLVKCVCMYVCM